MYTLALYCYSSTAVQLAVQFCWCLRTLLWRQGSYMRQKLSSYSHIKPFLRYLWSKGRLSEPSGKGLPVDPPTDHRDQFFNLFYSPFFLPDVSFFLSPPISCFLLAFLPFVIGLLKVSTRRETCKRFPLHFLSNLVCFSSSAQSPQRNFFCHFLASLWPRTKKGEKLAAPYLLSYVDTCPNPPQPSWHLYEPSPLP